MKIKIRNNSVIIEGYINAIERYSEPITEKLRGKIQTFIERIRAGVFRSALIKNKDVLVLLNHDKERVLARTSDGSAKLREDNIGLRAKVKITDKEVVEKARQGKLTGWSFGFYANDDYLGKEGNRVTRTVTDLDLEEVSILDDRKIPAYPGTSIEARSKKGEARAMEIRMKSFDDETEERELSVDMDELVNSLVEKLTPAIIPKLVEAIKEAVTPESSSEEEEKEEENGSEGEDEKKEEPEEKAQEEEEPEAEAEDEVESEEEEDESVGDEEEEEKKDDEENSERSFDLSDFEKRLAEL